MKKITILLTLLILCLGAVQAQDVYFAGNGNGVGKVWKNNTLVQSITDTVLVNLTSLQVIPDGTVYSAGYSHDSTYNFVQGRIWLNDSILFNAGDNTALNQLVLNGSQWTAAGIGNNEWENVAGYVWQNGEILYAFSDTLLNNQITALAIDTVSGDIYTGGTSCESESNAAIWKNDSLLWRADTVSLISSIAFDGTDLYAAGCIFNGTQSIATLWKNDFIVFQVTSDNSEFDAISIYDGSIYIAGYIGDTLYVWQDEEVLHSHPFEEASKITALVVNEAGVYYAGQFEGVATVWKDGEILYQPEDCESITGLCVLPSQPLPEFTLTVEVDSLGGGTVTGGGIYTLGDTVTIEAFPDAGYEFLYWNDSITDNPLTVVVSQDSTFVATFARIPYTIEVVSDHPEWGSVSGGGTFFYGDTIEIAATPFLGYVFAKWDDGNSDNPRTIVVTGDSTYTAVFLRQQCMVTTMVTPEGAGSVTGGGRYYYGDTITLVPRNNPGYEFNKWDDGNTDNPREIIVEGDATYTAIFDLLQYEITTSADPVEGGTVTGGGIYDYGSVATLAATPNEGYYFLCWNDGGGSNPRHITVTGDATYTALFMQQGTTTHTITVVSNNILLGDVTGSGVYPEGTTIEISATPASQAFFRGWDDGNTDNPRSIVVTQDMTFTAIFEVIPQTYYDITVVSHEPLFGRVTGSGTYPANTIATIEAIPYSGNYFVGWQDGNTDNPREILVVGNATYTAYFDQSPVQTYTVTVQYDSNQGYVLGAGTYVAGSTATLAAIPNDSYYFVKWGDDNTDNPREVLVDHDIILAAFFNGTSVDENDGQTISLYPNPVNDKLRIDGLDGQNEVSIYNAYGTCVKTLTIEGNDEISVGDLAAGLYLMRVNGRQTVKFVKR